MMGEDADTFHRTLTGELLAGYSPPPGVYDELLAPDGTVRPPWRDFISGLAKIGAQGLAQRSEQAKRLLRENGVTYNVFGAPEGPDRPWELDPLPLLFDLKSWQELAAGLAQRANLLNRVLADVYGSQWLLSEAILPPAMLFDHPGYLPPCRSLQVPENTFLHLYAGHLARQPDGNWVVLADRTQGPSGAGYAVENRIVISRTLPHDFESLHIERLASFFISLRQRLQQLSPRHRENPRIVLLSPGTRSNTYFEDGYLARYLGYTLVEGADLTVRGDAVFLKTLGGLLRVDVVVRRIYDEDCDPLELKPDSMLGCPGLVQAVRGGQTLVANALGSGFLEAPALAAFLPKACRLLLDEDLKLPSLQTWWCGNPHDLSYVEANLEQLIVRRAFVHRGAPPLIPAEMTRDQRQQLLAQLRARPDQFVAQLPVERSTAPVWNGRAIVPWRVGLRTFAVSTQRGYEIMPGGLARVFEGSSAFGESMSAGQGSKDVWILSDAPVQPVSLLRQPGTAVELRRSTADLPSRVADNLFWLGRHAERAEAMVRQLRSCVVRLTNEMEPTGLAEVAALVAALSDDIPPLLEPDEGDNEQLLDQLRGEVIGWLFDAGRPGALANTLNVFYATASRVRDRLSVDSWRIINQLNLNVMFPWEPRASRLGDFVLLLNQVLNLLSAFGGLGTESMTRGPGWRFLDMGRRIERAVQTLGLVRRTLVSTSVDLLPLIEAILEICDSSMTYRYRYLTTLQLAPLLDLVLIDETNPRAVGYQLNALSEHVTLLPGEPLEHGDPVRSPEQKVMLAAQSILRLTDVEALCEVDRDGVRRQLESFLTLLEDQLRELADDISHHYLTHTGPSRQLGMVGAGRGL